MGAEHPGDVVGTKPVITATDSGGSDYGYSILVQEVSGIITSSSAAGFADGTAGTDAEDEVTAPFNIGPPTYAGSAAGEYLVYLYGDDGSGLTWTVPGGYTADPNGVNTSSLANLAVAYKNSTGGTETGQYAISGSGTAEAAYVILVAFQLAAAAPGQSLIMASFV